MNIHAVGTSHRHSPVEIIERLAFREGEVGPALLDLTREIADEAAIVSTCNRTEIYVAPKRQEFHSDQLKEWLRRWKGVDVPSEHFFALSSGGVAKHLFEVASGVDSQMIGDVQIIGQVKRSYQIAREQGTLGKVLSRMFATALHTGKRVKSETGLFTGAASISYASVELARKIFHPLANKRTLVVGAGESGELTARSLFGQGVVSVTITNRTESRGRDLIERLGFGVWMPLGALAARLHEFDIVIVSTGATNFLITYDDARAAAAKRSGRMQLIVDISVPRNVDPNVGTINGIFCKDLNDLNSVIESNVERRRAELPGVGRIIAEELAEFSAWCSLLPVTPVIAKLKIRSDEVVRAELAKNRHRFSESEFQNVEKLVGSVVRKIIGIPMAHLLDAGADIEHTLLKAEFVSLLFDLDTSKDGSNNGEEEPDELRAIGGDYLNGNGAVHKNGTGADA